jgi:glycosyltransferase involved in cell wall biosynthesis
LIIAGAANGEEHEYWLGCRAIAEAHADAIEVREGFIENDALPALIGQIDAFLMPYRDFNSESGVAILAAANARPLIACAEGGIGAMFAEGAAGVVIPAPADAAAVAGAVAAFTAGDQTATNDKARAYQAVFCATREWGAIGRQFAALTAGLLDAKLQQSAPS